jgi:hypothetical protein
VREIAVVASMVDLTRRVTHLENIVVPRREQELVAKGLQDKLEDTEEALDDRLKRMEESMRWAFRMVAAAFIGFLFQGIIVLATLIGRGH